MSGKLRVLVVDPDALVREAICALLESLGMRAVPADTVAAALSAAPNEVDLALIEMQLDVGTGRTLARQLQARGVPALLMSTAPVADAEPVMAGLPVLEKPFRLHRLQQMIGATLARKQPCIVLRLQRNSSSRPARAAKKI
jgi:CheY-like chemotaxis protein